MREIKEGSVTLDSSVDSLDGWTKCIEYLYLDNYSTPSPNDPLVHARVYVLALKLCMPDLGCIAVRRLDKALRNGSKKSKRILDGKVFAQLVSLVYANTAGREEVESEGDEEGRKGGGCAAGGGDGSGSVLCKPKPLKDAQRPSPTPPPITDQDCTQSTILTDNTTDNKGDPMRRLIAIRAGELISFLRKEKLFMSVVRTWVDFAADLIDSVPDGPPKASATPSSDERGRPSPAATTSSNLATRRQGLASGESRGWTRVSAGGAPAASPSRGITSSHGVGRGPRRPEGCERR